MEHGFIEILEELENFRHCISMHNLEWLSLQEEYLHKKNIKDLEYDKKQLKNNIRL